MLYLINNIYSYSLLVLYYILFVILIVFVIIAYIIYCIRTTTLRSNIDNMSLGQCYVLASQYNVIQIKMLGENQNARYSHVQYHLLPELFYSLFRSGKIEESRRAKDTRADQQQHLYTPKHARWDVAMCARGAHRCSATRTWCVKLSKPFPSQTLQSGTHWTMRAHRWE